MFFNKKKNSSKKADKAVIDFMESTEKEFSYIYEFIEREGKFDEKMFAQMDEMKNKITEQNKQLLELSMKVDELYNLCSK